MCNVCTLCCGSNCISFSGCVLIYLKGNDFLKAFLKALVAICTLTVGWLLGVYLLDWFVSWKTALFLLACLGIGHIVYSILRVIDKRFR